MKDALEKGKISQLLSDSGQAGWSGEVHLLKYLGENYIVRRCKNIKRAKEYGAAFNKLRNLEVLPRFLGRYGKDLVYEYLPGRDLKKKESSKIIMEVGAIAAKINIIKAKGSISKKFLVQLHHLLTGYFPSINLQVKPAINEEDYKKIKRVFYYLLSKINPEVRLDFSDSNPENFRLSKGRVYFVDVEAIGPRIKGFGIGKAFKKWFKKEKMQKAFLRGYKSISSTRYLTKYYLDFIYLNFYIQELDIATRFGRKYKPRQKIGFEGLQKIIDKYEDEI